MTNKPLPGHNTSGEPGIIHERRMQFDARMAKLHPHLATSPKIHPASTKGPYSGAELAEPAVRCGADDHMTLPSRMGDRLVYRDGREVALC